MSKGWDCDFNRRKSLLLHWTMSFLTLQKMEEKAQPRKEAVYSRKRANTTPKTRAIYALWIYFSLFEDNPRRLDSARCDSKSLSQSVPKIEALIQSTRTFSHRAHKMEQLEMVELAEYLDKNIQCISTHICMRAHSSISLGIILEWRHFIYFVNVTIRSLFIMKSF